MIMVLLLKINFEPYNLETLSISGGLPCPSRTTETQERERENLEEGVWEVFAGMKLALS